MATKKIDALLDAMSHYSCADPRYRLVSRRVLERANRSAGHHFFDRDTMRFFDSRVASFGYRASGLGVVYFVTSEKCRGCGPRLYTVRMMLADGTTAYPAGEDFQKHATGRRADAAADQQDQGKQEKAESGEAEQGLRPAKAHSQA